jgi:hypothetical protein
MSGPDQRTDDPELEMIERLLEGFRPIGPAGELRERVLTAASSAFVERRPWRIRVYVWRGAVAAGLIAAVCLNVAAEKISTRMVGQIGIGPAVWTQEDEETARLLDGEGWGRRYLAMALRAGPLRESVVLPSGELDTKKFY